MITLAEIYDQILPKVDSNILLGVKILFSQLAKLDLLQKITRSVVIEDSGSLLVESFNTVDNNKLVIHIRNTGKVNYYISKDNNVIKTHKNLEGVETVTKLLWEFHFENVSKLDT
jgi:hypothetical protein